MALEIDFQASYYDFKPFFKNKNLDFGGIFLYKFVKTRAEGPSVAGTLEITLLGILLDFGDEGVDAVGVKIVSVCEIRSSLLSCSSCLQSGPSTSLSCRRRLSCSVQLMGLPPRISSGGYGMRTYQGKLCACSAQSKPASVPH